jgi:amino-acid N-acetyltransferase
VGKHPPFIIIRKPYTDEAESISELLASYAQKGIVLPRTVDEIRNSLETWLVAEYDNKIVGAVSRYDYGQKLLEIRSLVVSNDYSKQGIGSILVKLMIRELQREGKEKLFVLTYSPEFFKKNGFLEVPKGSLPEKIWKDCINCVNKDSCGETALIFAHSRILSRH